MITFFQEREIEKYLWEKKISGKLLKEIKDHMISQILEIQNDRSIGFEIAFEKTKLNWNKDLAMVRKNPFSRQKITKIAYEIDKIQNRNLFLRSMICAFVFAGFLMALAFLFNEETYLSINKAIKRTFLILPLLMLGMYVRQKRLASKNKQNNVVVNNFIHPLLVFGILIVMDNMIDYPNTSSNIIFNFVNFGSRGEVTTYVFIKIVMRGILLLALYLFSFFSLIENIKKFKQDQKIYN
ncbi:hypothetical protein [Chryseobacterium sp. MMS23-Vi53]|uniref:hypothetical protein n=1 Tax=Chryseobacterium sp. MMS23-Vi53 TaxID=3386644 RepID=UPI0039ECB9D1